jgi:hypothetical protein
MNGFKRKAAAFLLAAICCVGHAQNALSAAVDRISKTDVFAFGGIGFVGKTSQGEQDFWVIRSQPPEIALARFEKIFSTGNPQGRGYALVAIRQLDAKSFKDLLPSLNNSKETVKTMWGCIVEDRPLAQVAKDINSGRYDPWLKHHR